MISSLQKIFGSKTKAQEIIFLLHDAKEVVRQGFYPAELPEIEKFCRKGSIFLVKSAFKVLLEGPAFTNKGTRVSLDHPNGMYFVYFSKDERKAHLAAFYEQMGNDQELGLLLGYPTCCVDFFCKNFSNTLTNLELFPSNPYTNLSQRKNDAVLVSYFPCASGCERSIALAKRYLGVLEEVDEKRAKELIRELKVMIR